MIARLWGCTPAELRKCTARDVRAMIEVLNTEAEQRARHRR